MATLLNKYLEDEFLMGGGGGGRQGVVLPVYYLSDGSRHPWSLMGGIANESPFGAAKKLPMWF